MIASFLIKKQHTAYFIIPINIQHLDSVVHTPQTQTVCICRTPMCAISLFRAA